MSFLDADDLMMPYGLARMVELMEQNNATVGLHDYVPQHQPKVVRTHDDVAPFVRQSPMPPLTIGTHLGHVTVRAIVRDDKFGKPHGLLFVGECGRLLHAEADSSEEQALWLVRGSQWVIRGSC